MVSNQLQQGRTAMMGYTEKDIEKFEELVMGRCSSSKEKLINIYTTGICNTEQAETIKEIKVFFEGLIAEGRL
jgi:hypothetical protein